MKWMKAGLMGTVNRSGPMGTVNRKATYMRKKKELTKTQHMENNSKILNLAARLLVCAFLLAIIIYSFPL